MLGGDVDSYLGLILNILRHLKIIERDCAVLVEILGAFYLRRTFRILPMYYLTLAIYCVLILVLHADPARHDKFVRALPYYLTYLQEWPHLVLKDVPFELSWSLGIEEKFYLVWPVLGFLLLRKRFGLRVGTALTLAVACTVAACFTSS